MENERTDTERLDAVVEEVEVLAVSPVSETAVCPECGGTGRFDEIADDIRCDTCGGTGKVTAALAQARQRVIEAAKVWHEAEYNDTDAQESLHWSLEGLRVLEASNG